MDAKKIGKFIALNRKLKGLTQEQLGEILGVSNKTISRWENGNYMPDLSLLEPLSHELGITLNELLAGEKIEMEDRNKYTEENLINTLDYTAEKLDNAYRRISVLIMGAGLLLSIAAFTICDAESRWTSLYSILGAGIFCAGLFRELKFKSAAKRLLLSAGIFILALAVFLIIDYRGVISLKRPPIYRYMEETYSGETPLVVYFNPFYRVYRINAKMPNEYYIVDGKDEYTLKTVPISPFNRDKSGIDAIIKYKSDYVGDNSNDGRLINALPLSEYGFVFEIDSINVGLTIDYHFTDWYNNENLYIEKSLIYNSVSIFGLIDNVQYIQYNFSGSSYKVTRNEIEEKYPDYEKVFSGKQIDNDMFNQYVENRMNDIPFIKSVFTMFKESP